ncbi:MAG TPA: hypothetical protein VE081_08285 [Sporichthyaceae bacterium]|nr:hypothetical protein [Sporichthyaceae bacterium]
MHQRLTARREQTALCAGPNAAIALAVGLAYGLAGVVATAVGMGSVLATSGETGHPAVAGPSTAGYLTISLILLAAVATGRARSTNSLLGGAYLAAGVALALFTDGDPQLLTLNHPGHVMHLCTAALLVGFGRTQH